MFESQTRHVPPIRVPYIEAGEALLELGVQYEVPEQTFSALYIPLNDEILFEIGGQKVAATQGDIVGVPRGHMHSLRMPGATVARRSPLQPPFSIRAERHDVFSHVFCCRVPTSANPMPDIVPDFLHYKPDKQRIMGRLDLVFELIRHHALSATISRQSNLRRLAEIAAGTFLQAIIDDFEQKGLRVEGASSDANIRRALNSMHENPGSPFNLESLAEVAGLSRSAFAERFKAATGHSPIAYLSDHRLGLAARLLDKDQLTVSQVSVAVGFETDSAFTKAFRKRYGVSPSVFRRQTSK